MDSIPRFFAKSLQLGAEVTLDEEESHHLSRVLRLEAGDRVDLVDGEGTLAAGEVLAVAKRETTVHILSMEPPVAPWRITIAFGIPKNPALEIIVRKLTELGVKSFVPLITERSLPVVKPERWLRIIQEAGKQSQERWFPKFEEALPFEKWLSTLPATAPLFFCDEARRDESPAAVAGDPVLLVGPEGGWSENERQLVLARNVSLLGLGRNRLRAETAALVAAVRLKERLGELR